MDNVASKLKEAIGGLTEILIGAIGLLVVVQVVFGTGGGGIDIIGNITSVVSSFIGAGASLASTKAPSQNTHYFSLFVRSDRITTLKVLLHFVSHTHTQRYTE